MRFMLRAHALILCDLSCDLNFDIFLRTHILKKIERRINKINRTLNNYSELNVE